MPKTMLRCTAEAGLFSNERLIRFRDANGEPYSVLVDEKTVTTDQGGALVSVVIRAEHEGRSLIMLYHSVDQDRVWVANTSVVTG